MTIPREGEKDIRADGQKDGSHVRILLAGRGGNELADCSIALANFKTDSPGRPLLGLLGACLSPEKIMFSNKTRSCDCPAALIEPERALTITVK
jgi:hypothetical protein